MSTPANSYGSWFLDHPVLGTLIVIAGCILGGALGFGAAALGDALGIVSPGNVAAGVALGASGVSGGFAAALFVIAAISNRSRACG